MTEVEFFAMSEPKLRTIRKTRNKSKRFKRADVRRFYLKLKAELEEAPPRKRVAAAK